MVIKIEKGIPLPPKGSVLRSRDTEFDKLEVGDSFFEAGKKSDQIAGAYTAMARRRGWKVAFRQVDGGVRVWRVA